MYHCCLINFIKIDYIINISEICRLSGITDAVICPGSRSAPITISFAQNKGIKCYVIPDERSAAYIALGMAQQTQKTVVLVCTSGTAALNFAPAIAEAYFQQIPLLVLTADRPPEWVGQGDGQVINQTNIFRENIKESYFLPVDKVHKDSIWSIQRTVNEAIYKTISVPFGPVHINIPLREPLYPRKDEQVLFDKNIKTIKHYEVHDNLRRETWDEIIQLLLAHPKKMIVAGHQLPNQDFLFSFNSFLENNIIPVVTDINSNLQKLKYAITHFDNFLGINEGVDSSLAPDLIISFGNEFISKKLKNFLRNHPPKIHIQIRDKDTIVDTFQSVTHTVKMTPIYFFNELLNRVKLNVDKNFHISWVGTNQKFAEKITQFAENAEFGELYAVKKILNNLPENSILHTANSLSVRFVATLGAANTQNYCNRGTSGIDGCTSTAIGAALKSEKPTFLITGDVAFFYDRNALWHNHLPKNIKIVVLNNAGGNIFRTLEGAKRQPELEEYFVTKQSYSAKQTASDSGIRYFSAKNKKELEEVITDFAAEDKTPKLLEIFADGKQTDEILTKLKEFSSVWINEE